MISLKNLMGGATYHNLSADLSLGLGAAKVMVVNGNSHKIILPNEALFPYNDPIKYLILNVGAASFNVEYLNGITHTYYSISAASADNSYNAASGGLAIGPPGSWITAAGFSNGANNGTFQIVQRNRAGTKLIVSTSLANETVNVTPPIPPATTPLPPVSILRKRAFTISPGYGARFMLGTNDVFGNKEWYVCQRPYSATEGFTKIIQGGAGHTSICSATPTPPPPPPPPPPYDGTTVSLATCPATKTVTISGGTGLGVIWNRVYTVTLNLATTPPYYRYVLDSNHWVLIRYFPSGGGYGYQWQVILDDLTGKCRKRFGNNTAGTCPPNGSYTCFPVISENALCYALVVSPGYGPGVQGGPMTCVVSA